MLWVVVNLKHCFFGRCVITQFTWISYVQMVLFFMNSDIRCKFTHVIAFVTKKSDFFMDNLFVFLHSLLCTLEITLCAFKCQSYVDISLVCIQWAYACILLFTNVTLVRNSLVSVFHVVRKTCVAFCFVVTLIAVKCSVIMSSCEVIIQIMFIFCFILTIRTGVNNAIMHTLLVSLQIRTWFSFQVTLVASKFLFLSAWNFMVF